MKWCERHRQEITYTDHCPLGEMAGQECRAVTVLSRAEWEATIDYEAARAVLRNRNFSVRLIKPMIDAAIGEDNDGT